MIKYFKNHYFSKKIIIINNHIPNKKNYLVLLKKTFYDISIKMPRSFHRVI